MFDRMELRIPRAQNRKESWHRRFESLVGKCHVGTRIFTIIEEIKKEQIQVERRAEDILCRRAHSTTRR